MTKDIIAKLRAQLEVGITTEVQVVYLLAGIRKLIERDGLKERFKMLNFHCDWALHSDMDRSTAQELLKQYDEAHFLLTANPKVEDLPQPLSDEIEKISHMKAFRRELWDFLKDKELPQLTEESPFGWVRFLYLYARVIEDIPLVAKGTGLKCVSDVTVHVRDIEEKSGRGGVEYVSFEIAWTITNQDGTCGDICITNSLVPDA